MTDAEWAEVCQSLLRCVDRFGEQARSAGQRPVVEPARHPGCFPLLIDVGLVVDDEERGA